MDSICVFNLMTSLISLVLTLVIFCWAVDLLFGGRLNLAEKFVGGVFKFFFQVMGQILRSIFGLVGIVGKSSTSGSFNLLGWSGHQGFKLLSRKNYKTLVLGPLEKLKPGANYNDLFDYSQTASLKDIQPLTYGNPLQGDFWLGRYVQVKRNQMKIKQDVWLNNEFLHQHFLLVGATGSGKTELLLQSAANLMRSGNLVVVDAAGSLPVKLEQMARASGSKICCWDISGGKRHRVTWNFLEELAKHSSSEKEIRAIAEAIYGPIDSSDPNCAFWKRDIMWLTALIGLAVESRKQNLLSSPIEPSELPSLVMDRDGVKAILNSLPQAAAIWGSNLYSYLMLPDDRFALDVSFLQQKLSPFNDSDVRAICDGASDIFLLPAINGKKKYTIIIGQSLADGEFGSALAAIMISYIKNVLYRRMKNHQYAWTPTYIICDEAPRLKNLDYEELTAIGRQAKMGVIIMCQQLDQFSDKQLVAMSNCRTQMFLSGVNDKTAGWFSSQLGEYQRQVLTMSTTGVFGPTPVAQRQLGYERVPILGTRELMTKPGTWGQRKQRIATVRVNDANSPMTKVFLTDYAQGT
jgi:Type IV secretory system Conjugative DNA transfer